MQSRLGCSQAQDQLLREGREWQPAEKFCRSQMRIAIAVPT
jgi:hypothetical protein